MIRAPSSLTSCQSKTQNKAAKSRTRTELGKEDQQKKMKDLTKKNFSSSPFPSSSFD
jgi:hypothetical protein